MLGVDCETGGKLAYTRDCRQGEGSQYSKTTPVLSTAEGVGRDIETRARASQGRQLCRTSYLPSAAGKHAHHRVEHLPPASRPAQSSFPSSVAKKGRHLDPCSSGGVRATRSRVPTCAQCLGRSRCVRWLRSFRYRRRCWWSNPWTPRFSSLPGSLRSSLPFLPVGELPTYTAGSTTVPQPI